MAIAGRGLDPSLAKQVADQLMAHDAIGAHARDELGISEIPEAGRSARLRRDFWSSHALRYGLSPGGSSHFRNFAALPRAFGCIGGARGAGVTPGAIRVTFWGALAMGMTAGVGA